MGLGGSSTGGSTPTVHKIKVNSSTYGTCIPIVYGRARIPALFFWDGDFYSQNSGGGSGKGGSGTGSSNTIYFVSVVAGLCVGIANGFGRAWNGTAKGHRRDHMASLYWSMHTGALGQLPWPYLTTKHPGHDLGYTGIAYAARHDWNLGSSANLPNMTFEVFGLLSTVTGNSTAGYSGTDANAGDIIADILTNQIYACGQPSSILGNVLTTFKQYCLAAGYNLSLVLDQQKKATEWIKDLLHICNADAVWSGGQLNIVPFCDADSAGLDGLNGSTFSAEAFLTPVYDLTDDDYVTQDKAGAPTRHQLTSPQDHDPVTVSVTSPADLFNDLSVEYVNASNDYNLDVVQATDEGDIIAHGLRKSSPLQFHPVTTAKLARQIVQIQLQRQLHTPNQYRIRVPQRYVLIDPMDALTITDSDLGLDRYPVRIVQIDEEMDDQGGMVIEGTLIITAEDLGPNSTPGYNTQPPGPWGGQDPNRVPLPINPPIIFEPNHAAMNTLIGGQLKGQREIWILTSGNEGDSTGDYQGCQIYMSSDGGSTYELVGTQNAPAQQGTLTGNLATYGGTNPDTAHTLGVDLSESNGIVSSVPNTLAAKKHNLAFVDTEIVAFTNVAAVGSGYQYNLTRLYRGLYNSQISAHSAGTLFGFLGAVHNLDPGVFRLPITQDMIDDASPLYFKFLPINPSGDVTIDLSTCVAYTITPKGEGSSQPYHVKIVLPGTDGVAFTGPHDVFGPISYTIPPGGGRIHIDWTALLTNGTHAQNARGYVSVTNGASSYNCAHHRTWLPSSAETHGFNASGHPAARFPGGAVLSISLIITPAGGHDLTVNPVDLSSPGTVVTFLDIQFHPSPN